MPFMKIILYTMMYFHINESTVFSDILSGLDQIRVKLNLNKFRKFPGILTKKRISKVLDNLIIP